MRREILNFSLFVAARVCEASLEDNTRVTVGQHFDLAHPAENFASLADIPHVRDRGNPGLEPSGATEDKEKKKEKVRVGRERERERERDREMEKTADLNHNKGKKVVSSERILVLVNETSPDDEEEKVEARSAKRPRLELPAPGEKYHGALVPLPYVHFPRTAGLYSCTVCPAEANFSSLAEFEKHRESDLHRVQYGEKFRANNCRHFPDGAQYKGRQDLDCSYCPAKVGLG